VVYLSRAHLENDHLFNRGLYALTTLISTGVASTASYFVLRSFCLFRVLYSYFWARSKILANKVGQLKFSTHVPDLWIYHSNVAAINPNVIVPARIVVMNMLPGQAVNLPGGGAGGAGAANVMPPNLLAPRVA
jgi:hypothetical protein